jgi:Flp pilus assembly protein TadG
MGPRCTRAYRNGSQALEFALMLPILLSLAGGIVDLCHVLRLAEGLAVAVGHGAQVGARDTDPTEAAVRMAAASWVADGMPEGAEFQAVLSEVGGVPVVVVTGTLALEPLVGLLPLPLALTATTTARARDAP